jgi:hypothetical protein
MFITRHPELDSGSSAKRVSTLPPAAQTTQVLETTETIEAAQTTQTAQTVSTAQTTQSSWRTRSAIPDAPARERSVKDAPPADAPPPTDGIATQNAHHPSSPDLIRYLTPQGEKIRAKPHTIIHFTPP